MIEAPPRVAPSEAESPFIGLMPFSESHEHAAFFYGREQERQVITANLLSSRLTLLYGETGCGKSSVLRAGVVHHLRERAVQEVARRGGPKFVVVEFSSWQADPMPGLAESIRASVKLAYGEDPDRMPELSPAAKRDDGSIVLDETLASWAEKLGSTFLIILDQFEEYFLYHERESGDGTFAGEFARAMRRPGLRANFLISIREDAYSKLDRFKGEIEHLYGNYLRIAALDLESAREAIRRPIEKYNELFASNGQRVEVEPELEEAVLDQVEKGKLLLGQTGQGVVEGGGDGHAPSEVRIEAPYLQLVLKRIWDEEMAAGSSTLRRETLARLGEAEGIIEKHLDEAMGKLSQNERDGAARAFPYLVTPDGTKIAHTAQTLSSPDYADLPEEQLVPVLEKLCTTRILRSVASPLGESDGRYEIYHDTLAPAILDWRNRYEAERKVEQEKRAAEARARAARQRARRLAAIAAVAAVLVLLMGYLWVRASRAAGEARQQRAIAESQRLVAKAQAQLATDPQESVRLALQGWDRGHTTEAENALRRFLSQSRVRSIMRGHNDAVWSAQVSPDGSVILTVSDDGTAGLWDATTGERLQVLEGHTEPLNIAPASTVQSNQQGELVFSGSFSPDGRMVATSSDDDTARIWEVSTAQERQVLEGHSDDVLSAVFSPDGAYVATASNDDTAALWDVSTGDLVHRFEGHTNDVVSVAFSPNGNSLATASYDGTTRVWDVATGDLRYELDSFASWVNYAAFSPDGKFIAAGDSDGYVGLYRTKKGEFVDWLCCNSDQVFTVAFSPDSKHIVAAGGKTGRIYELGGEREDSIVELRGHTDFVYLAWFSPDGSQVATAGGDGTARVWDAVLGQELFRLGRHSGIVWTALFAPDGETVLTASEDRTVRMWDIRSGLELRGHTSYVQAAAFYPESDRIVTGSIDGTARTWDPATGELLHKATLEYRVNDVVVSPDGGTVAVGSDDGNVYQWDGQSDFDYLDEATGTLPACCYHDGWRVLDVAYSPDGSQIVATYADNTVRVWDVESGAEVTAFEDGEAFSAAFDPTGELVVTAERNQTARIYEVIGGRLLRTLRGHRGIVLQALFSPDGEWVATASQDGSARIWDARTGHLLRVLEGSPGSVTSISFSEDGAWVVGGTADGLTIIWDADSGQILSMLRMHADYINSVEVSSDGEAILTASDDQTASLYECNTCGPLSEILRLARAHVRIGVGAAQT